LREYSTKEKKICLRQLAFGVSSAAGSAQVACSFYTYLHFSEIGFRLDAANHITKVAPEPMKLTMVGGFSAHF
jgi:hypothetical protein